MNPQSPFTVRIGFHSTRVEFAGKHELTAGSQLADSFFCFDENTESLWSPPPQKRAVFPAGEEHKTLGNVEDAAAEAVAAGLSRDGGITAVGGGVVCDMGGFLASVYMRGVALTLVPTTLLAMVDASLGGKTGVDFRGYKNMLGTFYPAERVYLVPEFLESLPEEEFRSGLAEVIKHALLGDEELLSILEERREAVLARKTELCAEIIARSLRVKARYVEQDPREEGLRAHLNLGHTFAHALESCGALSRYGHGGAVAWGLGRALRLGAEMGITDSAYLQRIVHLLHAYGYRRMVEADPEELAEAMERDKKKRAGRVRFVLQRRLGETLLQTAERSTLLRVLRHEGE